MQRGVDVRVAEPALQHVGRMLVAEKLSAGVAELIGAGVGLGAEGFGDGAAEDRAQAGGGVRGVEPRAEYGGVLRQLCGAAG